MDKQVKGTLLSGALLLLMACNNSPSQSHGPIILGDSSTIVTEHDPEKLQDLVSDLSPSIPSSEPKDTATAPAEPPKETAKAPDTPHTLKTPLTAILKNAPQQPLAGNGLKVDFSSVSLLIPNVNAKQAGKKDLSRANDAVYSLISGTISGNMIKTTANVSKVSQRYQTLVVLKNDMGVLPLESLTLTTPWQAIQGVNNMYHITGLDEKSLRYADADRDDIREAVTKAARRHHMSRRKVQEWEKSVQRVRTANQKPLYIVLRSVMWKIDGKDANGRAFSKQVRVDLPM